MVGAYPELVRVRGHVMVGCNERPHYWCVTQDGLIVDPTRHQWDTYVVFYRPLPDDAEEPVGKCLNCGCELYRSRGDDGYVCAECRPTMKL